MGKIIDLKGQKFNRLQVVGLSHKKSKSGALWECVCDCGNEVHVQTLKLRKGLTKSCGCYRGELKNMLSHGMRYTPTYKSWQSMKERCLNPNKDNYKYYGAKGITICPQWVNSFEAFLKDMGERPKGLSLDRIDNNSGYSPENCRWADSKTQSENRPQCTTKQDFCAKVISMCSYMSKAEIARSLGVSRHTVYKAIKKGLLGMAGLRSIDKRKAKVG